MCALPKGVRGPGQADSLAAAATHQCPCLLDLWCVPCAKLHVCRYKTTLCTLGDKCNREICFFAHR